MSAWVWVYGIMWAGGSLKLDLGLGWAELGCSCLSEVPLSMRAPAWGVGRKRREAQSARQERLGNSKSSAGQEQEQEQGKNKPRVWVPTAFHLALATALATKHPSTEQVLRQVR